MRRRKFLYYFLDGRIYTEDEIPDWEEVPLLYAKRHPIFAPRFQRFENPELQEAGSPSAKMEKIFMMNAKKSDIHLTEPYAIDEDFFTQTPFPLIEDFEVVITTTRQEALHRPHRSEQEQRSPVWNDFDLSFFSPSLGFLTRPYSFWSPQPEELCRNDFLIPYGDFRTPYSDFEHGWIILIARKDEFVYILQGDVDAVRSQQGYHTWYKVRATRYGSQWDKLIQLCKTKVAQWREQG